jgi:hypothetical protein
MEQQEQQTTPTREADEAARAHEAARQARATVEEKCLLGFLNFARQRRTA